MEDQAWWSKVIGALQAIISSMGLPWVKALGNLSTGWNLSQSHVRKGLYEVLNYETTLELKDKRGKRAFVKKFEKVNYLQDTITTFHDQAWGNGKILIDYQCSPGVYIPVRLSRARKAKTDRFPHGSVKIIV
jgi:hypothetical protein